MSEQIKKAPQRQSTPSGKIIDTCKGCGKYGIIWSGSGASERCKACAVENKATDAGIDAMRGDGQ
jgi:hypothetical protein